MADSLCVCGHRVEDHAEGYEGSFPCGVYEPGGPRDPSGGTLGQLCGCNYFTPPPPRAMVTGGALLRMEASPGDAAWLQTYYDGLALLDHIQTRHRRLIEDFFG